ncbi:MAG TPA: hypothetical protein V6D50_16340 [Chroococcales cyanobacterium]
MQPQFPKQSTNKFWVLPLVVISAWLGGLLSAFYTTPLYYGLVCLGVSIYGTFAIRSLSFILSTIVWLLLLVSTIEFSVGLGTLASTNSITWPITGDDLPIYSPAIELLSILFLVKFTFILLAKLNQFLSSYLPNTNRKPYWLVLTYSLIVSVALSIGAIASWHWHVTEEISKAQLLSVPVAAASLIITILALLYTLVQAIFFTAIIWPISRAGTELKKSLSRFHTFFLLATASSLSLGLGWVVHLLK